MTVEDNDAWACVHIGNMQDDDNTQTEPESLVDPDGLLSGELAENLYFTSWVDQGETLGWQGLSDPGEGDNIWQGQALEPLMFSNEQGPASDVLGGKTYTLADPSSIGGPIQGNVTNYIGLQWCLGEMTNDGSTITCDGSTVGNEVQTDSLFADMTFYVEQARNNPDFACENVDFGDEEILVGASLGGYDIPDAETECTVVVDDSGTEDFTSIQAAIDASLPNDTICVADGVYNEFSVDQPLTIAGLVNPETSATVVPSAASVNYLANVVSSDVTITGLHLDGDGTTFTGNQLAGVHIANNGADMDNIHITYNLIENLDVSGTNPSSKGIQWHDDNSGFSLTNSSFTDNVIRGISSTNKGGYGIQTVGDTDGLMIAYNTISDVTGAWGAGVAIDGLSVASNTATNIMRNHIMDSIWFDVSVQVEHNADQTGVFVNENNIEFLVHGSGTPASAPDVDATDNWWGDADPSDDFTGPVNYTPFALSAYNLN